MRHHDKLIFDDVIYVMSSLSLSCQIPYLAANLKPLCSSLVFEFQPEHILIVPVTNSTHEMPIDLYYMALSAPCRAVILTAKVVGVDLTLKHIDLMKGEQMQPEFLAINPRHTVPFIVDDGFHMSESRAICAYLANKYSKNDSLYPKDPKSRAVVDNRLYFDMGVFYEAFSGLYYPVIFRGATSLNTAKRCQLDKAIEHFNAFLSENKYAAGSHLTVADLTLLASASTMKAVDRHIFNNYPKINEWMECCKAEIQDYHALNEEGAEAFAKIAHPKLEQLAKAI